MEIINFKGQTEITPDEKRFLKLPITTMEELNTIESIEITKARLWALSAKTLDILQKSKIVVKWSRSGDFKKFITKFLSDKSWFFKNRQKQFPIKILSVLTFAGRLLNRNDIIPLDFLMKLHKKMFSEIWSWAGKFRTTDKNIGVPVHHIQEQLKCLIDDTNYWQENAIFPLEEIALRFHHKLVQIHVFNNGNGRHARLLADCFLKKNLKKIFDWDYNNVLHTKTKAQTDYLNAMKKADNGDYTHLLNLFHTQ